MITNNELRAIISQKKMYAAQLLRSTKLNGDIKNIHLFCGAIRISTSIYYSVVKQGQEFHDAEKALDVIDGIEKIQSGEIVIPKAHKTEEPDFQAIVRAAEHAGKRKD